MLPVRINLLLILVTLLFSCNTKPKNEKISSGETIVKSKDEIPAKSVGDNNQGSIKKEIVDQSARKNKRSSPKNSFVKSDLVRIKKSPQPFIILPHKDTTLNGEEGTVIKIKQASFVYAGTNIDVTGALTFNISEYYKLSDIMLANLSTESNGRMLETGGMIFIEALSEGKECELKNGSTIEMQFPFADKKEGMQLFTGKWEKEGVNWEQIDNDTLNVFTLVDVPAQFPGGSEALIKFILSNITSPDSLLLSGFGGQVSARFEIDERGKARFLGIIESFQQPFTQTMQNLLLKMPLWKPAIHNGRPVKSRWIQPVIFYYEEGTYDTAYKRNFEKQMEDERFLNTVTSTEINRYVFSTSKLGWINCDRFYNDNKQKLDLFVRAGDYEDLNVKLVFHRFRSIVPGVQRENAYKFMQVPIDEKVTVVAIATRNQRNFVAFGDYSTNSGTIDNLVFQQVTNEGLKEALKKLDSIGQDK